MKKLIIGLFALLLFISVAQTTEASWLGDFFRSIFGGKAKIEKVVPAESQGAKAYDAKLQTVVTDEKPVVVHTKCPEALSVSQIVTYGMRHKDVAIVQGRLICLGYLKGTADGSYGKLTVNAVSQFQRDNGIVGNGMSVDERTLALLGIRLNRNTTLCAFTRRPDFTPNPINPGQGSVFSWETTGTPDCVRTIIRDFTDLSNVITTNLTPAMGGSHPFPGPYSATRNFVVYTTDEADCSELGKLPSGEECHWRTVIAGMDLVVLPIQTPVCSVDITANPTSVTSGNSSNLTWTSSNCTRVFLDGVQVALINSSGQSTGPLSATRTYTLTGTNVPGCTNAIGACLSDSDQATVTVTTPPPVACTIPNSPNSFVVPTTVAGGPGFSFTVSWSTSVGCRGVIIETNTGMSTYRYEVPSSGTRTFTSSTSDTDNTLDITLIASDMTNIVSQTKTVAITGVLNPQANQCAFNSVSASPNPTSGTTTLSWSAPSECWKVHVIAWTPNNVGEPMHSFVWNPATWPGIGHLLCHFQSPPHIYFMLRLVVVVSLVTTQLWELKPLM
jgi:peptidoglycan hydrolase-like protein with peptidoglycan-binding domain